jgi:hypothetical protein
MASKASSSGSSGSRSRGGSSSSGSRSRSRQSGNGGSPSQSSASQASARESSGEQNGAGEPDVVLDVQQLKVDEIGLEVENLHARIALEAKLGDLLQLYVGADVVVDKVALEIKGVDAQAQLTARLDNVLSIIDRTLKTVDQNPELLKELAQNSVAQAALEAGSNEE